MCLASANRDENVFENPDEINSLRNPNEHLAFGGGSHACLGATIARQEMRLCLKPMLEFLKEFTIDETQPVHYAKQIMMRTIESVAIKRKTA